jgi:ribosomal small subunit protein bTHX
MGKGDKRSFKGKVFKGSYGKTRRRKPPAKAAGAPAAHAQPQAQPHQQHQQKKKA